MNGVFAIRGKRACQGIAHPRLKGTQKSLIDRMICLLISEHMLKFRAFLVVGVRRGYGDATG